MKHFIQALLALIVLAFSGVTAKAQQNLLPSQWYIGQVGSLTNTVGTNDNITVNLGNSVAVMNGAQTLRVSFKHDGSASGAVVFTLLRSFDNVNWETTPGVLFSVTANGTTTVNAHTNLGVGGLSAPYVKLGRINNAANAANLTNIVVQVCSSPTR